MLDQLYCPDFSAILGPEFRNPYDYPMIDSLIWPTLTDVKLDEKGKKLIELSLDGDHPVFYRRKIPINNLVTELKASGLKGACMQAIDLGREYGISSEIVIEYAKKYPKLIFPIISPLLTKDGIIALKKNINKAVAVVIYPSYQNIDLAVITNELKELCKICLDKSIPIKIDLGNMYFPNNTQENCTPAKVRKFVSSFPNNVFILSGIDILGDGLAMINILRFERNLNLEFDPRTFGGITPVSFFTKIFEIPGFVQNNWNRILLGSVTPMLESSQLTRGWWNATEKLPFAQQCLLRTWMYRNIHHIYKLPPLAENTLGNVKDAKLGVILEPKIVEKSENELFIQQDLALNSFSITQLLYITPIILEAVNILTEKFAEYPFGEFTLKSYHTTTSIIVNEHEFGNYLQLHYQMAEDTMLPAEDMLHTVAAAENRADFNYPDHILASTRGDKDFTVPIMDNKIQLGGRENLYVLVTFGPRSLKLSMTIKLFKGKKIQ
jgi:thiamine phosphate synthase YjbQ (UPF0047 family)